MRFTLVAVLMMMVALGTGWSSPQEEPPARRSAATSFPEAAARLSSEYGAGVQISIDRATQVADFVRLPIASGPRIESLTLESTAALFLTEYGALFGITDPSRQLTSPTRAMDIAGGVHLTQRQVHRGVPVFGGEMRLHFSADGGLTAVNGLFVPDIQLDTTPRLTAEQAGRMAVAVVVEETAHTSSTRQPAPTDTQLVVYRTRLLQGLPGTDHLAFRVVVTGGAAIREFVFIDAVTGKLIDRFSGVHETLTRHLYDPTLMPANLRWSEGEPLPPPGDWLNEIDGAGEVYNLFGSLTNGSWLSYDGASATMLTVNDDPEIECPNANWNGTSTNYCTGVSGDDTVAHEWAHAVTEYTHNLIYAWQSGALNESYSDIWGEVVDLLNGRGSDSPGVLRSSAGAACSQYGGGNPRTDNSYRWLSGEDDTAFYWYPPLFVNAIRDMWRPECYSDPGKVTSSSYMCSTDDQGGVHSNSGVPNHGFALLVDGGSYNGQTVNGIGLTKTAHIYWQAETVYQTTVSDFADHASALEQSCADLIGTPLPSLVTTGPDTWGGVIPALTAEDCAQVTSVIAAVELRTPPACGFVPMLDPDAPALCVDPLRPVSHLAQDFESGLGDWTVSQTPVHPATWTPRIWSISGALPDGRVGSAAFGPDPTLGDCSTDLENGTITLQTPLIAVPPEANTPIHLAFDHYVSLESGWDGGVLTISIDGGSFSPVPSAAITFNPYNGTLGTASDNPLEGQAAYTGADEGSVSGSWGQSQVDLSAAGVDPGETVQLRWNLGTDSCGGWLGWFVDDVSAYTCESCSTPAPVANLQASPSGDSVHLSWDADPDADHYEVWSALDDPYFDPVGMTCTNPDPYSCVTTASTSYDAPDLGVAGVTHAYVVRAAGCFAVSGESPVFAGFGFEIVAGEGD